MKKIFDGFKFGLGIFLFFGIVFGLAWAVGFHSAEEILGGTFIGDYKFQGDLDLTETNVNFTGANISGLSSDGVPSGAIIEFNDGTCPNGYSVFVSENIQKIPSSLYFTSQYDASTHAGSHITDGDINTIWSTSAYGSGVNVDVSVKFPSPTRIDEIRIYPRASCTQYNFKNFAIYGSIDSTNGVNGNWDLLDSGLSTGSSLIWETFTFPNQNTYLWYRISGPAQPSGYYVQLGEVTYYSSKVTCTKD